MVAHKSEKREIIFHQFFDIDELDLTLSNKEPRVKGNPMP